MNLEKKIPTRNGFGEAIVELGKENRDILVVDIDIGKSCKTAAERSPLWSPTRPSAPCASAR